VTLVQVELNGPPRKPSDILENSLQRVSLDAGRVSFGEWRAMSRSDWRKVDRGWHPFCDLGPAQRVAEGRPESIKELR
jgi:hypothetical protein